MSAERQAIGRSRGGLTTKLMAMVDKTGRLVRFTLRLGNAAEAPELPTPLDGVLTNELIADKAYSDAMERAADHFDVSKQMVGTTLVNNGIMGRESITEWVA